MSSDFQVSGTRTSALFTLKVHRGDGMALLAMNWKTGTPPVDFVGFAIEYKEPNGDRFFAVKNRISFLDANGKVQKGKLPSNLSPIQKFRWVHFPRNAELDGKFEYRVTPVFMNEHDELSYGDSQEVAIELNRVTYPGQLNVTYTRGFVASQAFVDRYDLDKKAIGTLLPKKANQGLGFKATHPDADKALEWMGFEARDAILELLDEAIADSNAEVRVVAYDLNEPEVFSRLKKLGKRLKIVIDDSPPHHELTSAETEATKALIKSAGAANVKRQHMGQLQHNKTIVVNGPKVKAAVCGSTNFTWRALYVQNNNAMILRGEKAIKPFLDAFDSYWANDDVAGFGATAPAEWADLGLTGIDAKVAFSPHIKSNALLASIANDIADTKSSLLFSLAFLYQTKGLIRNAIQKVTKDKNIFVYGISDKKISGDGLDILKPDGKRNVVNPSALSKNVPEPFKSEPTGGIGNRMHHKFVVIDFDKPTARVYLGSYNFSSAADVKNGENLLVIRDRRIVTSYMIEALRIFDHCHFRLAQEEAATAKKQLFLAKPPRMPKEKPWWNEDYTIATKILDREIFA